MYAIPPPPPRGGGGGGGGVEYSHTWAWYGVSSAMTPVFIIFNLIDPLFLQKKIGLSLSHLVPEILGHKVGLIFH